MEGEIAYINNKNLRLRNSKKMLNVNLFLSIRQGTNLTGKKLTVRWEC